MDEMKELFQEIEELAEEGAEAAESQDWERAAEIFDEIQTALYTLWALISESIEQSEGEDEDEGE